MESCPSLKMFFMLLKLVFDRFMHLFHAVETLIDLCIQTLIDL